MLCRPAISLIRKPWWKRPGALKVGRLIIRKLTIEGPDVHRSYGQIEEAIHTLGCYESSHATPHYPPVKFSGVNRDGDGPGREAVLTDMLSGIGGSTSDCGGVDTDSVESDIALTRSGREKVVNNRLAHTTELYLFALVQFTITADTDVFFLAFRRRFLFRSAPANNANNQNNGARDPNRPAPILSAHTCTTLYGHLSHI
ncbi:hypothetical protein CPC08DRAFT_775240 [Agrocybe pediades]|nr:hypothetical protein CPC08DRAFT_775240 [Agrocybe pediades]